MFSAECAVEKCFQSRGQAHAFEGLPQSRLHGALNLRSQAHFEIVESDDLIFEGFYRIGGGFLLEVEPLENGPHLLAHSRELEFHVLQLKVLIVDATGLKTIVFEVKGGLRGSWLDTFG